MRKIEEQMISAIVERRDWRSGNTEVAVDHSTGTIEVFLHRNRIAEIDARGFVRLSDAGWQTVTTKSRLNAIARHFNVQGVYQRNHVWYFDNGVEFWNWRSQLSGNAGRFEYFQAKLDSLVDLGGAA